MVILGRTSEDAVLVWCWALLPAETDDHRVAFLHAEIRAQELLPRSGVFLGKLLAVQVDYRVVHKSPPPVPVLNHMIPAHTLSDSVSKIDLNIIFRFTSDTPYGLLISAMLAAFSAHPVP